MARPRPAEQDLVRELCDGFRQVSLFRRMDERPGRRFWRTSGRFHWTSLQMPGVRIEGGATHEKVVARGVCTSRCGDGTCEVVGADAVVHCTGQQGDRAAVGVLVAVGASPHVIEVRARRSGRMPGGQSIRVRGQLTIRQRKQHFRHSNLNNPRTYGKSRNEDDDDTPCDSRESHGADHPAPAGRMKP